MKIIATCLSLLILASQTSNLYANKKDKAADMKYWQHTVEIPRFKKGKQQSPAVAHLWIPENTKIVKGIIFGQKIIIEGKMVTSPIIRNTANELDLAILYISPGFDALFNTTLKPDSLKQLIKALQELGKLAKHPELEHAPFLTIGHSTAGIFCRNVAYWAPERTIGVIHIKSGNMHQHIPKKGDSLAGIPFVAINGEFEQYGPEGGGKQGIREAYGKQTQWVMIRQHMLKLMAKDREHLMNLIVHRGSDHFKWDQTMMKYCALFIRKAVAARVPEIKELPTAIVKCKPIKAEDGWLTDANIKNPQHAPATFKDYKGDKAKAYWHFDKELAEWTANYHKGPWEQADPSEDFKE